MAPAASSEGEVPSPDAIERAWRRLDPIFVLGMQRSGTSIVTMALHEADCRGFAEGHLWHELIAAMDRLHSPQHLPELRRPLFALGDGRDELLARRLAVAIDQFHRSHVPIVHRGYAPSPPRRWVDKTPGSDTVALAPRLAQMFPAAQFIFVHRDGAATVESGCRKWPERDAIFHVMCRDWARTMRLWHHVAPRLGERALVLAQADLSTAPEASAASLACFVGAPDAAPAIATLFAGHRENSAFPDRAAGDYHLELDWSHAQRTLFTRLCGAEMERWGYPMPFTAGSPRGQRLRRAATLLRQGRVGTLLRESAALLRWQRDLAAGRRKSDSGPDL